MDTATVIREASLQRGNDGARGGKVGEGQNDRDDDDDDV